MGIPGHVTWLYRSLGKCSRWCLRNPSPGSARACSANATTAVRSALASVIGRSFHRWHGRENRRSSQHRQVELVPRDNLPIGNHCLLLRYTNRSTRAGTRAVLAGAHFPIAARALYPLHRETQSLHWGRRSIAKPHLSRHRRSNRGSERALDTSGSRSSSSRS